MIDVIYVLGRGSQWSNNEIRHSLRSIQKHLKNYRNVWIIGELPDFLKNINHIPLEDTNKCKETNIYKKVLRACEEKGVSEDFIFFNDDHFLNADFDAPTFPFFYKGDLLHTVQRLRNKHMYGRYCSRTMKTLHSLGFKTKNFDIHTPIIYNKQKFINTMTKYDWTNRIGFVVKSLYANSLKIEGEEGSECKINRIYTSNRFKEEISDKKIWSIGDASIGDELKKVMEEMYPEKSIWEK